MKLKRALGSLLLLAALAALGASPVSADSPYRPFDRSKWQSSLAAPDAFTARYSVNGTQIGSGALNLPTDFAYDASGRMYIADTGNHRLVLLNSDLSLRGTIDQLHDVKGNEFKLREPSGVFVGQDGAIYVTDKSSSRALKMNSDGLVLQTYDKPADKSFTSETFSPVKIAVDKKGMVYVISENVYQGIMLYNNQGVFQGFFGSPKVTASPKLMFDLFWKSILSSEQRKGLAQYVPVEYDSMDIDSDGFVYAVQSYTSANTEQLRKLNFLGNNILTYKKNFGEKEAFGYKKDSWYSKLTDVAVDNGFIYALDSQWQRINVYDSEGNRLVEFGTEGEQLGSFRSAAAITVRNGQVCVLDRLKGSLTFFTPTEYGSLIFSAVELYNRGDYTEAVKPWQEVLARDANNELAYNGIAEAKLKDEKYGAAVQYFRLGQNTERESVAYEYLRANILRAHIGWVLLAVLLLLLGLILFTNKHFLHRFIPGKSHELSAAAPKRRIRDTAGRGWHAFIKTVEGFNELKFVRYQNIPFVLLVLLALFLASIFSRQCTGFRFSATDPEDLSLLSQAALTVIPLLLYAVANWAICAIMDGEGKFGEILTFLSVAALPYIVLQMASTVLSNMLVLKEAYIFYAVYGLGAAWSLFLLFQSQRIVHGYSGLKTLGAIFLTVAGVAVILVILLLIFSLAQQVIYFLSTVYTEILYRK